MKKMLLMLGLVMLPTMAMAAPDFSGTWIRNNANSDPDAYPLYWITRPGPTMGGGRNAQFLMSVHESGDSLQVGDSEHPMRNYTLDGKPHTRATDTMLQKAVVTADAQGNDVVIETTQPFGGMPGNATLKEKEVWSLSPDGKTLTITLTRDLPARQQTMKEVFSRTEGDATALCSAGCVVLK